MNNRFRLSLVIAMIGSAHAFNGNTVTVFTWYLSKTTHLEVSASCYFYLSVSC